MSAQPGGAHARHRLDPLIHMPIRLSIVACLAAADQAEFGFVRDTVEVSDSVLSKHATVLAEAGYVRVRKGYVGKWPRTWLSLTAAGRRAFQAHLAALSAIAALPATPSAEAVAPSKQTGTASKRSRSDA